MSSRPEQQMDRRWQVNVSVRSACQSLTSHWVLVVLQTGLQLVRSDYCIIGSSIWRWGKWSMSMLDGQTVRQCNSFKAAHCTTSPKLLAWTLSGIRSFLAHWGISDGQLLSLRTRVWSFKRMKENNKKKTGFLTTLTQQFSLITFIVKQEAGKSKDLGPKSVK